MDAIQGKNVVAWWYNPRNREATEIGKFPNTGTQTFISPDPAKVWIGFLFSMMPAPNTKPRVKPGEMKPGISSYTYTWAIGVPGNEPENPMTIFPLMEKAAELEVRVVQVADNLPLDEFSDTELRKIREFCGRAKNSN